LQGKKKEDGTIEPVPETNTGILRYTVHQAKDLDASKSLIGQLSPYVLKTLNGRESGKTKVMKRTNNPIWEEPSEILITDRKHCKLGVVVKDDRDLAGDPLLGSYQIKLDDMLDQMAKGTEWFNLAGVKSGRIKLSAQWKPVAMKGAIGGSGGYITPIGVLRIHLLRARDLINLETVGKSDPYVRVLLSGIEKAKTVTIENELNPAWDEILYVPVHSTREKLTLEVMDSEKLGKDRSLGQMEFNASDYVKESDVEGEFLEHNERRELSASLYLGRSKSSKGSLFYNVSFYPCLNMADPEDEESEKEKEGQISADSQTSSTPPTVTTNGGSQKLEGKEAELLALADQENEGEEKKKAVKVKLTPEELLKEGMIIVQIFHLNHLANLNRFGIIGFQDFGRSTGTQRLLFRNTSRRFSISFIRLIKGKGKISTI